MKKPRHEEEEEEEEEEVVDGGGEEGYHYDHEDQQELVFRKPQPMVTSSYSSPPHPFTLPPSPALHFDATLHLLFLHCHAG